MSVRGLYHVNGGTKAYTDKSLAAKKARDCYAVCRKQVRRGRGRLDVATCCIIDSPNEVVNYCFSCYAQFCALGEIARDQTKSRSQR